MKLRDTDDDWLTALEEHALATGLAEFDRGELVLAGSVRRSAKERRCDACSGRIARHERYFATGVWDEEAMAFGPHSGWFYYCLSCAAEKGHIAVVLNGDAP